MSRARKNSQRLSIETGGRRLALLASVRLPGDEQAGPAAASAARPGSVPPLPSRDSLPGSEARQAWLNRESIEWQCCRRLTLA